MVRSLGPKKLDRFGQPRYLHRASRFPDTSDTVFATAVKRLIIRGCFRGDGLTVSGSVVNDVASLQVAGSITLGPRLRIDDAKIDVGGRGSASWQQ